MKRQPTGGKRTLPRGPKKSVHVSGLPPAVIGGVEGGHVCERCGKTVPADQMTAGGQNCRDCGHPAHLREVEKKKRQRARVRRQFLRAARDRNVEVDELEELLDKAAELHGGVRELARAIRDDFHVYHEQHPGSPKGIQHLWGILQLMVKCDKGKPTLQESLETLSDEELDEVIRVLSDEVLAELTQAASAAETAGADSN